MKTNFKFDHTKDDLGEAIGFSGNIPEMLQTSTEALVKTFEEGQAISSSVVIEGVLKHFSDVEIVILAGMAVKDAIVGQLSSTDQMIAMMQELGMTEKDLLDSESFIAADSEE